MAQPTKFNLREEFAANFETALKNAGMQRWTGTEDKPKYWRGKVKDILAQTLFLQYDVTDNQELDAADNKPFRRALYANGALYTWNGFSDADFQDLAEQIELQCAKRGIIISFDAEGVDTSTDTDNPLFYCDFEAQQRILMK